MAEEDKMVIPYSEKPPLKEAEYEFYDVSTAAGYPGIKADHLRAMLGLTRYGNR